MTITLDEARFFDALGCLVVCLDRRMNVCFVNRRGLALLGYASRQAVDGRPWATLLCTAEPPCELMPPGSGQASTTLVETALKTRDGRPRPFLLNYGARLGEGDEGLEAYNEAPIVVLGFDVPASAPHHPARRADDPASQVPLRAGDVSEAPDARDASTGLPDRNALQQALDERLFVARRHDKEVTLLHVLVEELGVGDGVVVEALATEMAARVQRTLRESDTLARIGRDAFGVLLGPHDAAIDDEIGDVAQRVLVAINTPLPLPGGTIRPIAAIGIVTCASPHDLPGDLLDNAAKACALARAEGGNCFSRFDPATASHATRRRDVLLQLRKGIDDGELVLHYQPQISLSSGAVVGLEALVRWQHPQRGLLPPGEFIPFAEQSSHIVDLGRWVLEAACRQMRAWLDDGLPAIKVAINLAARHFHVAGLPATIAETLAAYRIDARCLEIEITEGAMMHDVAAAIRATRQLKAIGVRLSLDDFGTGYSSLAYLSRFPIDVVKIDQSFVADITSNPTNAAIAQATIAMSHKLGKIVLAEGVENEEQMRYLKRCECDEMQGYHFSKPLAAADVAKLLRRETTMRLAGDENAAVLFVDDEAHILASIRRALRREGYQLLVASNASEAFSLLATHNVQVIVSDQQMPEMNGTEFLARAKGLYPQTVRMVLSGYSDLAAVTDAINKGAVYRFLQKPWDDEQLKAEITGALRYWRELYAPRNAP